jgi:hypothetical protein
VGIIKVINLGSVEQCLKEMVELSFQINMFHEEYEDVLNQMKANKKSLSSGRIPREVYNKNYKLLENEKKRLVTKINETVEKMKIVNGKVAKITKENRI